MGPTAQLKRRCVDGRTLATLCGACRSVLGPRHMTLRQLEAAVLEHLGTGLLE
jgi:hypothetical protein